MRRATFREYTRLVRGVNQFLQLLHCDCINGYAVGKKRTEGKETDDLSVIIFVNEKLSLRRLPLANRIPKVLRLPDDRAEGGVLEFITDVQQARFNAVEYTMRERPARSGISIGHFEITAGTLGGLVRDLETGRVVILSNNHVLAASNEGSPGDPIIQPGAADGGSDPADRIALLTRFAPIDFSPGAENRVDAAIATPLDPEDVLWNAVDIGPEVPLATRRLDENDLGEFVHKTGRTTEHTQGFVQALFATVQVKYDLFKKGTFVDQIIVSQNSSEEDFSNGGDSGSLVYDAANRCVGLLFAGSQSSGGEAGTTILNPIHFVLQALNVELLSSGDHPSGEAPEEGEEEEPVEEEAELAVAPRLGAAKATRPGSRAATRSAPARKPKKKAKKKKGKGKRRR